MNCLILKFPNAKKENKDDNGPVTRQTTTKTSFMKKQYMPSAALETQRWRQYEPENVSWIQCISIRHEHDCPVTNEVGASQRLKSTNSNERTHNNDNSNDNMQRDWKRRPHAPNKKDEVGGDHKKEPTVKRIAEEAAALMRVIRCIIKTKFFQTPIEDCQYLMNPLLYRGIICPDLRVSVRVVYRATVSYAPGNQGKDGLKSQFVSSTYPGLRIIPHPID